MILLIKLGQTSPNLYLIFCDSNIYNKKMCFSATASFGASAILLGIGTVSLKNTSNKNQKLLFSIPLIFSIQQFLEGMLWLSINDQTNFFGTNFFSYTFLFIAQVLWPIFIPYSIRRNEVQANRRKIISILLGLGIIHALYFGYGLINYPIFTEVSNSHLLYKMEFKSANIWYGGIFYILATGISPFISSIKKMNLIGLLILITYAISFLFYRNYIVSVWCYFATIISVIILIISMQFRRQKK